MLRSIVSRVDLLITVLGGAVLSASLLDWGLTLHAPEGGSAWVEAASSNAPAIETAEIWQVSADCERPFFVKAVLQSKAILKNHYDLAPEDVRAWRTQPAHNGKAWPPQDQRDYSGLVNAEQHRRLWNVAADMERGAKLHAQYAEWFATASRLEAQANNWEQRLINIADQRVMLSDATRRSFGAYSQSDGEPATAKSSFERHVLFLLGLGGFPGDEERALKATCVNVMPVKKIFKNGGFFSELWRWPVEHVIVFSLGLEFVLIGILFVPVARWIGTGDATTVRQYVRHAANRLSAVVRDIRKSEALADFLRNSRMIVSNGSRALVAGCRALLRALMKR